MKKIVVLLAVVLAIFACKEEKGYKIEITLEGAEPNTVLILEQYVNDKSVIVDSLTLVNGKGTLKGEVEVPEIYLISIKGQQENFPFYIENVKMKMTGQADSLQNLNITGSKVNDEFKKFQDDVGNIQERLIAKNQEYLKARQENAPNTEALLQEAQNVYSEYAPFFENFVRENPSSWIVPMALQNIMQLKSIEETEELIAIVDPKVLETPDAKKIIETIEKQKIVNIGRIAPDFTQNDPDGNPIRLSDIYAKNKYTLIDFWAAWCGPCRQENPHVVRTFNEFKDKGFGVFGISLDRSKEDWLKAIKDDKLTWPQVSDLKYWQNEAAQLYLVRSIPANFLVDSQGKIVAKNLRGEALHNKMHELLP